jgi:hypothetical protein
MSLQELCKQAIANKQPCPSISVDFSRNSARTDDLFYSLLINQP